jgi:hypothetical protein
MSHWWEWTPGKYLDQGVDWAQGEAEETADAALDDLNKILFYLITGTIVILVVIWILYTS